MKFCVIKQWIVFCSIFFAFIGSVDVFAESQEEGKIAVSPGKKVSIEYTLKLKDESVVDTNVGSEPLSYTHGSNNLISGLENELEGMEIGDSKHVTVKPEEAYGPVDEEKVIEVKKEEIPQDALKVGAQLQGKNAGGQVVQALVKEIKEKTVMLDFNHPLAGKTLYFDVKIVNIQE